MADLRLVFDLNDTDEIAAALRAVERFLRKEAAEHHGWAQQEKQGHPQDSEDLERTSDLYADAAYALRKVIRDSYTVRGR